MEAMIHSLGKPDTVEEIRKLNGDNKYAVKYNGEWCSAIYNPFSGYHYADNIYGRMTAEQVRAASIQTTPAPDKPARPARAKKQPARSR